MLADFTAGIIHWLEDAYSPRTPVSALSSSQHPPPPLAAHFHSPDLVAESADLLGSACSCRRGWWFGFLSCNSALRRRQREANQVHKWSHRTRTENGPVIRVFQDIRVLQTRASTRSITPIRRTRFIADSPTCEPTPGTIHFWERAERSSSGSRAWLIARHFESRRRARPAWLTEFRRSRSRLSEELRDLPAVRQERRRAASRSVTHHLPCFTFSIFSMDSKPKDFVGMITRPQFSSAACLRWTVAIGRC